MTTTTKTLAVRLQHTSGISGASWCEPVGWEPANEISGAEYIDGSWWDDHGEAAGILAFIYDGEEGDVVSIPADDLRIAACGDVRVISEIETK